MKTVGITALIPPELIFACGKKPCDVNNFVPKSNLQPASKLCAWTAIWRDMILRKELPLDSLVVVAGGDCHNALVDGEKVALSGIPTFYFFYPFEKDVDYLQDQLDRLSRFLGGIQNPEMFERVSEIKKLGLDLDELRAQGKYPADKAFKIMVSFGDFKGDIDLFEKTLKDIQEEDVKYTKTVALLGVPPINCDFHEVLTSLGLHVVYDELPYEFVRLSGNSMDELAENYCDYTFARNIEFRLEFLKNELKKRNVDGVIHYTQFACHHLLEDDILRKNLDYPFLTIQGDLPGKIHRQVRSRLEAFSEMLNSV
ncbi:MAG: 2-hydroxyacyl-CoA dehydratase [Methanomassiliicoccales archaeon]|nr:MAG: 2-hydroxyacyl-CoA dehydratase [Methanomassiliicoccales archaeon]